MQRQDIDQKPVFPSSATKEPDPSTLLSQCWRFRNEAKLEEAFELCHSMLSQHPQNGDAWHLMGLLFKDRGDHQQALRHLQQAIAVDPDRPHHYNNMGVLLNDLLRHSEAMAYFNKALSLSPDYLDAKCNMGLALCHCNKMSQASDIFIEIISVQPENAVAHSNLGLVRLTQHRYTEAASAYRKAIGINPVQSQWNGNLGAAYLGSGEYDLAVKYFRIAVDLSPDEFRFHLNLGVALRFLGRYASAIKALNNALIISPDHPEAISNLIIAYEQTCHWMPLKPLYGKLDQSTRQALIDGELPHEDPMLNIRRSDDLALNRAVSQAWSQNVRFNVIRQVEPFTQDRSLARKDRIIVGYLSNDFRDHPVAHQIHPLFRLHDRHRFRILAFSLGPDDGSAYRKEIENNSDDFFDLSQYGPAEASQIIFDQRVDILIDLMGHSKNNRMGILALRPAPLQVSYLGFLSTTGADFIDYVVADDVVLPPEHQDYYNEKAIRMPVCYQLNHRRAIEGQDGFRRKDHHLPPEGFVFCCFNVGYKIDPPLFEAWMRILQKTPGSVLWVYASNTLAIKNMREKAGACGVNHNRLVFADKLPLDDHLKRLSLADLALDTVRYNGGATTANALGAALPVLTVLGRHWVSRMSASHLIAAGLPELAVNDLVAYEEKAVELATNPEMLDELRRKLLKNNQAGDLFNGHRFIAALESGLESIWNRHLKGKPPKSIQISKINSETEPLKTSSPPYCGRPRATPKIFYCCPDTRESSAGIRRLYRHVNLLGEAGYQAHILHQKRGFVRRDLPPVPVTSIEQLGSDKNAIFVIPEGMPKIMHSLSNHPGRRWVIALSWHYIFSTLPDGIDWRHFNIERVLAVSPVVAKMVSWSMDLPVHILDSGIDHQLYFHDRNLKRPQVSFISRKAVNLDRLKRMLGARNPDYINHIKWIGLDGLSEKDYADQIRRSSLFVTTSMAEGIPTSCLEAMAAGTIVAGYAAVGGNNILIGKGPSQNCILAPNGDYVSLAYGLDPVMRDLTRNKMNNWTLIVENARKTASNLTKELERTSLVSVWDQLLSTDRAGHKPTKVQLEQL